MTENPHYYDVLSAGAWNEGYAAGDVAGFSRGIDQMIKYIEDNPQSTIKSFYDHFEELIDNGP